MEISGKIIAVLEARGGVSKTTGNSWKTQDYVIETHEQFPHRMCFNVFGEDKIAQMNIQEGDELTVYFDINAREYQGRWFNDIRAWKVERGVPAGTPAGEPAPFPPQAAAPAPAQPVDFSSNSSNPADDLPF